VAEALLIIDFQNDFTPGGALGVEGGDQIAGRLNELAADPRFEMVVATRDWHPADHGSFAEQGGVWPVHCVGGTFGAELRSGIDRDQIDVVVDKGQARESEGYSAFEATGLEDLLRSRGVDAVDVAGLALDYCVRATALDARRAGFDVVVHLEATRAVEVEPGDGERAVQELRAAGVSVV
jgi:nicotinamidase/pyrazinamidase